MSSIEIGVWWSFRAAQAVRVKQKFETNLSWCWWKKLDQQRWGIQFLIALLRFFAPYKREVRCFAGFTWCNHYCNLWRTLCRPFGMAQHDQLEGNCSGFVLRCDKQLDWWDEMKTHSFVQSVCMTSIHSCHRWLLLRLVSCAWDVGDPRLFIATTINDAGFLHHKFLQVECQRGPSRDDGHLAFATSWRCCVPWVTGARASMVQQAERRTAEVGKQI